MNTYNTAVTDHTAPEAVRLTLLRVAAVVAFAALTAVAGQFYVPLPFTPVPITLQTLCVVLAGVALGPRLGLVSMGLYLLLGVGGVSVFAEGHWGYAALMGSTGGYLLGFALAQPLIGRLTAGRVRGWRLLGALLAGHAVIFACGLVWLACALGTGVGQTLTLGFVPFIPGLVVKTTLAWLVARPLLRHVRPRCTSQRA